MTTPEDPYPWVPASVVLDHLRTTEGSPNVPAVERARRGAASVVEGRRADLWTTVVDPEDPDVTTRVFAATDAVLEGTVLLAARLYARTGSALGLATYGDFASVIMRTDPDIGMLLGIGRYARPVIG